MAIAWVHTIVPLDLTTKRIQIHAVRSILDANSVVVGQFDTTLITSVDTDNLAAERVRIKNIIRGRFIAADAHQAKIDALKDTWENMLNTDQMALED